VKRKNGKKIRKKAIVIAIAAVMVMTVLVGAAVGTDGILIPVSQADSVTIVERTVGWHYLTYSVDQLMSTGATWTSAAGEQYTFTSDGTYLKIECYDEPGPGLGVGGNIAGVRLDGVSGYPEGVWATIIVSYSLGLRGKELSLSRILGSDLSTHTNLGDYNSYVTVGFGALPYVVSSDISGGERNTFDLSESVYCYAGNLPANDNVVHIYVVPNRDDWAVGDTIGSDVSSDGLNTVSTDSSGNIDVTEIWPSPLDAGQYDIVVDWDQDGELDEGEPVDAMTTAGFEAIPEFTTIAIPVATILGLVFLFSRRSKHGRRNN
jgi:hypothetical protein